MSTTFVGRAYRNGRLIAKKTFSSYRDFERWEQSMRALVGADDVRKEVLS